jgi:hypothetical protein
LLLNLLTLAFAAWLKFCAVSVKVTWSNGRKYVNLEGIEWETPTGADDTSNGKAKKAKKKT